MRHISGIRFAVVAITLPLLGFGSPMKTVAFPTTTPSAFDIGSLNGTYASTGDAGSGASVSVGVASFDGNGSVTRTVRVNAEAPDGGRLLIDITSEGNYVVNADGTGVIQFTNTLPSGDTTVVNFEFVIIRSTTQRVRGSVVGEELFAIQREPGVTASPVTETFHRR